MKLKNFIPCLATSLLLVGAGLVAAEDQAPPDRAVPSRGLRGAPGGAGRMKDGGGPVMSVLTEEQRASMRQAMQAQSAKMREVTTKLREARRELMLAGADGKFNEEAVRKQAMATANLEAELAVLRAKALSQIQPPLSAEQIEKIRNSAPAGPGAGARAMERPAQRRNLSNTNRDANDLPPKK